MINCNRDMCIYNNDGACRKRDIVLKVVLNGDYEEFNCESYNNSKK